MLASPNPLPGKGFFAERFDTKALRPAYFREERFSLIEFTLRDAFPELEGGVPGSRISVIVDGLPQPHAEDSTLLTGREPARLKVKPGRATSDRTRGDVPPTERVSSSRGR
ncbi:hypothetical protein GCM10022247_07190 [Allokutzneria multivorans]|uniref:Uncharacterized protein n=1 Tax=Allokutzneria multivorans TaxID=1142134 RepID=A0ABP7R0S4_9PSEU